MFTVSAELVAPGKSGIAITLITPSEYRKLTSIQRIANATITKQKVPNVADVIESKNKESNWQFLKLLKQADRKI